MLEANFVQIDVVIMLSLRLSPYLSHFFPLYIPPTLPMLPSLPPPLTLTRSFAHSCHTNGDKFDMTHSIPLSLAHPQNLLSLLTSSLLSLYSSRSCLLSLLTLSAPSSPSSSSLSSPSHPPSSSSNQHWSTTQRLLAPTLSKANGTPLPDSRHSSCVISHKACLFASLIFFFFSLSFSDTTRTSDPQPRTQRRRRTAWPSWITSGTGSAMRTSTSFSGTNLLRNRRNLPRNPLVFRKIRGFPARLRVSGVRAWE